MTERPISIHEILNAHSEKRLVEVIGTSTPSFVQPIKRIVYKGKHIELETKADSHVAYLHDKISEIMFGSSDHKWVTRMCEDN